MGCPRKGARREILQKPIRIRFRSSFDSSPRDALASLWNSHGWAEQRCPGSSPPNFGPQLLLLSREWIGSSGPEMLLIVHSPPSVGAWPPAEVLFYILAALLCPIVGLEDYHWLGVHWQFKDELIKGGLPQLLWTQMHPPANSHTNPRAKIFSPVVAGEAQPLAT